MKTNAANRRGEVPLMQQTKTWVLLYAFGIAVLALSLFRSQEAKPEGTPQVPASVVQRPSDVMRP